MIGGSLVKNYIVSILGIILIASVVFSIYSQNQLRQVPNEYSFDIATEDFYVKDIHFVSYHNVLYVSGNYYLEKIGGNKEFDGVSFVCTLDGTSIMSFAQSDNPFELPDSTGGRIYFSNSSLLDNMRVRKDDIVKVEINYKVNGKFKQVIGDIKLSDFIKPYITTGSESKEPIRL